MEPVKGLGALLETLRRRFEAIDKVKRPNVNAARRPHASQTAEQVLQSTLLRRLKQLSSDDPERTEKASTIIVSEALADRFGEDALNDPEFIKMIEAIKRVFVTESAIRAKVERFLDSL